MYTTLGEDLEIAQLQRIDKFDETLKRLQPADKLQDALLSLSSSSLHDASAIMPLYYLALPWLIIVISLIHCPLVHG